MATELERFEDYVFTVKVESHWVGFVVKQQISEKPPLYKDPDDQVVETFEAGETFLEGSVKWDGCSNWSIGPKDCMAHFCGRKMATGLGRLMDRLYQITEERLPTYNKEIAA